MAKRAENIFGTSDERNATLNAEKDRLMAERRQLERALQPISALLPGIEEFADECAKTVGKFLLGAYPRNRKVPDLWLYREFMSLDEKRKANFTCALLVNSLKSAIVSTLDSALREQYSSAPQASDRERADGLAKNERELLPIEIEMEEIVLNHGVERRADAMPSVVIGFNPTSKTFVAGKWRSINGDYDAAVDRCSRVEGINRTCAVALSRLDREQSHADSMPSKTDTECNSKNSELQRIAREKARLTEEQAALKDEYAMLTKIRSQRAKLLNNVLDFLKQNAVDFSG